MIAHRPKVVKAFAIGSSHARTTSMRSTVTACAWAARHLLGRGNTAMATALPTSATDFCPFHSITSSAVESSDCGTVRPTCLAIGDGSEVRNWLRRTGQGHAAELCSRVQQGLGGRTGARSKPGRCECRDRRHRSARPRCLNSIMTPMMLDLAGGAAWPRNPKNVGSARSAR